MYNPCIAIDVSKGKSHIQGFLDNNVKFTNAKPIKHNKEGFEEIPKLINEIEKKTNITPIVIFEYTGIYHKTLEQFLKNNNIKYHPVPPLQAAKIRQTEIHSSKDDKRDCYTLSQVYYLNKLNVFYNPSQEEIDLRQLHKQYCMLEAHYQKIEVNFYEYLDTLYPNYHSLVSEVDSYSSLNFLFEFPHPYLIFRHRHSTLVNKYEKLTNHSQYYSYNFINDLLEYINSIVPGDTIDSISVSVFKNLIEQALFYKKQMDEIIARMYLFIKDKPLYNLLISIPGVGMNTACRFIAEIGDMGRFNHYSQITSYAGLDPIIYQSGQYSGKHLPISKKGNKRLRLVLFIMARSMTRSFLPDNHIQYFYQKKKAQPNCCKKVALVACANKLIKIIYQMNKKNETYSFTSIV